MATPKTFSDGILRVVVDQQNFDESILSICLLIVANDKFVACIEFFFIIANTIKAFYGRFQNNDKYHSFCFFGRCGLMPQKSTLD